MRIDVDALIGAEPGAEAFAAAGAAAREAVASRAPTCTRPRSTAGTWPASSSNERCEPPSARTGGRA